MEQTYLDPRDTSIISDAPTQTVSTQLPPQVREFGFIPDTSPWLPGDLVLVSPVVWTWTTQPIFLAQKKGGFSDEHARWHHAAVYVGHNFLCEADTSGVNYVPIYRYVGKHLIRVRRDHSLTLTEGYDIAIAAMARLKGQYGFGSIIKWYLKSLKGFWQPDLGIAPVFSTNAVICSELYYLAYAAVTQKLVVPGVAERSVTPAHLSATDQLQDVQMEWRSI
jgi:hypothetical protein